MTKHVNQNRKFTPPVVAHYAYMGVNVAMIVGAIFVIWSFLTREYEKPPGPADPITKNDFDKSLEYLEKNKETPHG